MKQLTENLVLTELESKIRPSISHPKLHSKLRNLYINAIPTEIQLDAKLESYNFKRKSK